MPSMLPARLPGKRGAVCSTKPGVNSNNTVMRPPTASFSNSLTGRPSICRRPRPWLPLDHEVAGRFGLTGENDAAFLVTRLQPLLDRHGDGALEQSHPASAAGADAAGVI